MSLGEAHELALRVSFPRVSGDEPYADDTVYELSEFSPRERG